MYSAMHCSHRSHPNFSVPSGQIAGCGQQHAEKGGQSDASLSMARHESHLPQRENTLKYKSSPESGNNSALRVWLMSLGSFHNALDKSTPIPCIQNMKHTAFRHNRWIGVLALITLQNQLPREAFSVIIREAYCQGSAPSPIFSHGIIDDG